MFSSSSSVMATTATQLDAVWALEADRALDDIDVSALRTVMTMGSNAAAITTPITAAPIVAHCSVLALLSALLRPEAMAFLVDVISTPVSSSMSSDLSPVVWHRKPASVFAANVDVSIGDRGLLGSAAVPAPSVRRARRSPRTSVLEALMLSQPSVPRRQWHGQAVAHTTNNITVRLHRVLSLVQAVGTAWQHDVQEHQAALAQSSALAAMLQRQLLDAKRAAADMSLPPLPRSVHPQSRPVGESDVLMNSAGPALAVPRAPQTSVVMGQTPRSEPTPEVTRASAFAPSDAHAGRGATVGAVSAGEAVSAADTIVDLRQHNRQLAQRVRSNPDHQR
jgi:hypothetical protein